MNSKAPGMEGESQRESKSYFHTHRQVYNVISSSDCPWEGSEKLPPVKWPLVLCHVSPPWHRRMIPMVWLHSSHLPHKWLLWRAGNSIEMRHEARALAVKTPAHTPLQDREKERGGGEPSAHKPIYFPQWEQKKLAVNIASSILTESRKDTGH